MYLLSTFLLTTLHLVFTASVSTSTQSAIPPLSTCGANGYHFEVAPTASLPAIQSCWNQCNNYVGESGSFGYSGNGGVLAGLCVGGPYPGLATCKCSTSMNQCPQADGVAFASQSACKSACNTAIAQAVNGTVPGACVQKEEVGPFSCNCKG